ncbi:MAG TPA: VIT domain-containing protein [Anaerolineaceae bacterium]|nr:VIT domain-containing protein [Anaerolineaceae bacterium]
MTQPPKIESIIGRFIIPGEMDSALPLKKTTIEAEITGPLVSVFVNQFFSNPISSPAELDYLFPLPERAAIVDFELQIGSRIVKAEMQELDQARREYEEASRKGQRAGLLEQRRPNLFAVHLTNILPGETIQAALRYQDRLKFTDGTFELVFPMGLTPRYHTTDGQEEARQTSAPVAVPGEEIGPVEIRVSVDAGAAVNGPESPTHALAVTRQDERHFQVSLAGQARPDHDFVMRYALAGPNPAANAWISQDPSGDYLLAALFPPALPEDYQAARREFVFVLDRSGSMRGEPIAQARNALRACLRSLNPDDLFHILLFDDQLDWFRQNPAPVTQKNIDEADRYLAEVEGRGGTEILKALEAVFTRAPVRSHTRYIVFLTDGAVSAEERALQEVRKKIGEARLFTFGIGPSVNRALLNGMARTGHGTAEFLQLDEDIEGAIIRFQDRVSFPILTDLCISWKGAKGWDVYPAQLPDLYAGQPLEFCARASLDNSPAVLSVHGKRDGKPVDFKLELEPVEASREVVRRVWGRARIDDLLDQLVCHPDQSARLRAEIISTALAARLVTPFTAFVAIDQEAVVIDATQRKVIHVAQPLPKDLDRRGFDAQAHGIRQPATPFPLSRMAAISLPRKLNRGRIGETSGSANFESNAAPLPPTPGFSEPVEKVESVDILTSGIEETLRWLARTQQLDGSWNSEVEMTSAALLAFVRHGHTTTGGNYRQILRRAYAWLQMNTGSGQAVFVRAMAFARLAKATRHPGHAAAAAAASAELPEPGSITEQAIYDRLHDIGQFSLEGLEQITTLEQLRLAAIMEKDGAIAKELLKGPVSDLIHIWFAVWK